MSDLSFLVSPGGESLLVSPGGEEFFYRPEQTTVAVSHRKRRKVYTRERDNLNIYWQADDVDLAPVSKEKPSPRLAKPARTAQVAPKQTPDEVVPLAQIEALAREYDQMQAYRKALQQKQWERMALLYERLQDEADIEFLIAHL